MFDIQLFQRLLTATCRKETSRPDPMEHVPDYPSEMIALQKENSNLKNQLSRHEVELESVKEKLKKTEEDLEALSQAYSALDEHSNNLSKQLETWKNSEPNNLDESAIEDLLVCLGQEEEKNARLVAQLEALGIKV